jgi:hypothetical protein
MATFDYTEFTDLVNELVDEFGQEVSFLKIPRTVVNNDAPHRKPAVEVWDLENAPAGHFVTANAVSIGEIRSTVQGEFIQQALQDLIQTQTDGWLTKGPAALGVTLDDFTSVQQGEKTWAIRSVYGPNPGGTVLFYWLEVEA